MISKFFQLVRTPAVVLGQGEVNDTVTVPFVKGSGTEVASAGCTSYT